jgi:hypothetical protein
MDRDLGDHESYGDHPVIPVPARGIALLED